MLAFAGDVLGTPSPSDAFVLFGGQANTYLSDTWTFTDNKWSTVCGADAGAKSCGPSPRAYHSMAYDSMRSEVIVFGGRDDAGPRRDTWAFSMTDQSWSPRCATDCDGGAECCSAPTARSEQSMAYDVDRHVIVLFGGKDVNGAYLADTWEWDGAKWTEHHGSEGPGARSGHAMSGGPSSYGVVLFGGTDKSGPAPNPLWVWDGGDWTSVVVEGAAPIPRAYGAMSFDAPTSTLLLFGGGSTGELNDTWTLSLERTLVDAGCPSGPDSAPSITTCAQLQLCCASLTNTLEQQACEAIVAAADEDTCQTVRAGFVDAGTCH